MSIDAPVNSPVATRPQAQPQPASSAGSGSETPAAETEFTFDDFLDIINPLQHIPLVSILYRELTGDEIHGASRIIGGLLYGGPLGFIGGIVNAVAEEATGRDIADNAIAALFGESEDAPATAVAEADAGAAPHGPRATEGSAPFAATQAAGATAAAARAAGPTVTDGPPIAEGGPVRTAGAPAHPRADAGAASGITAEAETVLATAVLPHGMPVPARGAVPIRPLSNQPTGPARPVTINSRLDAALSAMAASNRGPARPGAAAAPAIAVASAERGMSAAERGMAAPAGAAAGSGALAPPPRAFAGAVADAPAAAPGTVPRDQVPAAMQRALDLYQRQARAAGGLPPP